MAWIPAGRVGPTRAVPDWADYQSAFDDYASTHLQATVGGRMAAGRVRAEFNHWLAVDRGYPPVVAYDMARLVAGNPALQCATSGRGRLHLAPDLPDDPLTGRGAALWRGIVMHSAQTHP